MHVHPSFVAERGVEVRCVHGHRATVLIVAARSATVHCQAATLGGQAATVLIVAGRSATVGTVALKDGAVTLPPRMLLFLSRYISHVSRVNN